MMKAILVTLSMAALLAGCNLDPPQRDVFVPPYAEKGCWARFYGAGGFDGPVRQLEGPNFVEAMAPLFDDLRSVVVGPHAKLVGYAKPLFREQSLFIAPGTSVKEVAALDFHARVESFELLCEAG